MEMWEGERGGGEEGGVVGGGDVVGEVWWEGKSDVVGGRWVDVSLPHLIHSTRFLSRVQPRLPSGFRPTRIATNPTEEGPSLRIPPRGNDALLCTQLTNFRKGLIYKQTFVVSLCCYFFRGRGILFCFTSSMRLHNGQARESHPRRPEPPSPSRLSLSAG